MTKRLMFDIIRCLVNTTSGATVNLQDYENKAPTHYGERLKIVESITNPRIYIDPLVKDNNGKNIILL